ncbi:MAG: MarR family transcriptional regulator [Ilumatobacteraceae bacterium]
MPDPLSDAEPFVSGLRLGVMRLARRLRRERGDEDLTLTQLALLGTLEMNGSSTLGELAAEERISAPSVTRIVNAMVEAGLVTRRAHETDGRQVVAELTPAATTLLDRNRRQRNLWLAEQVSHLSSEQHDVLRQAIDILDEMARA